MIPVKTDVLLYIESSVSDNELTFNNTFLPDTLSAKLKTISDIGDCFFSVPKTYSGTLTSKSECLVRNSIDDISFWKELFNKSTANHIIKILCDSPFLDISIIHDMLKTHTEYIAEFTYSENLPQGFTCEIISRKLVESVPKADSTLPLTQVIRSNINQFDVELFYRDPDIRDKRLSFRSSFLRDRKVMENMLSVSGGVPAYSDVKKLLEDHPEAMYAGPSYLEIELNSNCDEDCIFCCRKNVKRNGAMDAALFTKIMDDMKVFALPYTICLGGLGEPLMHAEAVNIMKQALENPQVERLIVETNGLYIDEAYISLATANTGKLITIVNMNGYSKETYNTLHKADKFEPVLEKIMSLSDALNKDASSLFVQIMKINETEPFLDAYYDFWEEKKVPIILQKQNTYIGKIEDRRYSDLTPLERTPCWHLERDMFILNDGTVCFCKQDIEGKRAHGNISQTNLAEIYTARMKDYIDNRKNKYPSSPDCASCDEWYTFNF